MEIFRVAAELFLIYLLYKFIFGFVVPIYESTKTIKKQFGEMHTQMQKDLHDMKAVKEENYQETRVAREGDYIDFEEIK
ncbi:MAG: hypothetical protein KGM98_13415 [Bacteroidota bacterium]|nr:hypothetical protein [Bacteroidota bacterium]